MTTVHARLVAPERRLMKAALVLGVIACAIAGIAVVLTVLSFLLNSQGLQMVTALLVVPVAGVCAAIVGLAGLVCEIIAVVRSRRAGDHSGVGSEQPRWVLALVLNIVGGLGLPILLTILILAVGM